MMKDIQERRFEKEEQTKFKTVVKSNKKDVYNIEIEYDGKELNENLSGSIVFLVVLNENFPFKGPRIYCLSDFCFPNICDGRDLLEDIIGQNWIPSYRVIDIVEKIPGFLKEFIENLNKGLLVLVGNFYLGDKYDLALFHSPPLYVEKVKEKININGKEKKFERIMVLSDIFFLLFEQEKWNKNNLKLIFWSNIRSLVTIRKTIKGNVCKFYWKQKIKNKAFEQILEIDESNQVVDILLDRMSKFGINYKISKQNQVLSNGTKAYNIDIETIEKTIAELEAQVEHNPDQALIEYLMDLYGKAVEYFSATNDPKYEEYTNKIHSTLNSPRLREFLEKEDERDNNDSQNNENNEGKEKNEQKIEKDREEVVIKDNVDVNIESGKRRMEKEEREEVEEGEKEDSLIENKEIEQKNKFVETKPSNDEIEKNYKNDEKTQISPKEKDTNISNNIDSELPNINERKGKRIILDYGEDDEKIDIVRDDDESSEEDD